MFLLSGHHFPQYNEKLEETFDMAVCYCLVVHLLLEKINEGKAYLSCVQHCLWAVHVETEQLHWAWQHAICRQMGHILELGKVKICPQGTSGGCMCIMAWWWDSRSWLSATLDGLGGVA